MDLVWPMSTENVNVLTGAVAVMIHKYHKYHLYLIFVVELVNI